MLHAETEQFMASLFVKILWAERASRRGQAEDAMLADWLAGGNDFTVVAGRLGNIENANSQNTKLQNTQNH